MFGDMLGNLQKQQSATETQKLLGGMMPPGGFGDLFK